MKTPRVIGWQADGAVNGRSHVRDSDTIGQGSRADRANR
jgi:hypothetical protein